jgi:hypothetical protein
MRHTECVLLFILVGHFSSGQSQPADQKKKAELKVSVNYNTGLNYYGRVDSLHSSGVFPLAELWFNESFYINAAPVFVNNAALSFQYTGIITSVGYQFNSNNKWLGNIYLIKSFYQESSDLVQSALNAQSGMTLTWLNKILNVTAGGDVKFSDKTDYGVTAGLDHVFRHQVNARAVLVVDPSVYVNAGTQQFTKSYLKRTTGFLFVPGSEQVVTESAQTFTILSYEFSAPVIFATGKLQLLFTPAYVIPQNLLIVEGRPDLSELGDKLFYATIGAKVRF